MPERTEVRGLTTLSMATIHDSWSGVSVKLSLEEQLAVSWGVVTAGKLAVIPWHNEMPTKRKLDNK